MKRLMVALGLALAYPALPCLNDRDTLGYELKNRPDVQRALTGRFDRYPPLYFQMRIQRLKAKGKLSPADLDDMAVAYGRLGKNDEGLAAMAQKAKFPHLSKDEQYRLFANRGTLKAHKWFHDGAKKTQIALLKEAENDIAAAINLNPRAHFGREGVQLAVLRWVGKGLTTPHSEMTSLGDYVIDEMNTFNGVNLTELSKSLSGLVMLGGAWESPDVALAIATTARRGTASFAILRYHELIKLGRKPIFPDLSEKELYSAEHSATLEGDPKTKEQFRKLRNEADQWHHIKTEYMLARLKKGLHPDTDPNFWSDWEEIPMPTVPTKKPKPFFIQEYIPNLVFLLIVAIGMIGLLLLRDKQRKKLLKANTD